MTGKVTWVKHAGWTSNKDILWNKWRRLISAAQVDRHHHGIVYDVSPLLMGFPTKISYFGDGWGDLPFVDHVAVAHKDHGNFALRITHWNNN